MAREPYTLEHARALVQACGLPPRDPTELPDSPLRFPDGCHWRHEVSGISSIRLLETLVTEMNRRGIAIHRVIFGLSGCADRMPMSELRAIAQIAREAGLELIIEPGVESKYDVGRHVETDSGRLHGVRVRGADQLVYQLASILRCVEAGIRGFLLRGECSLALLAEIRRRGGLPSNVLFKASYSMGHANPAGARLLEQLGADSFNPITDLTLPMLAGLRQVCRIPMDLVVFGWPSLGSIKRQWDVPEFARVAAPVYLKQEVWEDPVQEVRNCEILEEIIARADSGLKRSGPRPDDLRVPEI